ncbi:unnamed protein product [Closterium sp. NIES-65]|nr:unnamed protein product [Closterium sp. NIES-65]
MAIHSGVLQSLARSLYPVASVHPALISAVHSAAAALLAVSGSALAQESSRVLSSSSRQFENSNSSNPSTAAAKSLNSSLPHSPSPHSLSPHSSPHSVRPFSTSTAAPPSSPFARPPHQPLPQHKDLLQLPPPPPVPQRRVVVTGDLVVTRTRACPPQMPPPLPVPQLRVAVTSIGMVTPLGMGATATWQRLIGGDSAIRALTPSDIAVPGMTDSLAAALLSQLPSLPSHMPCVVPPPFETSALPSLCAPLSPLSSPSPSLHAPFPPLPLPSPGIGMVTPLGVGSAATWQRLIGGNSAIRALTPSDIAIPGMTDSLAAALLSQLPSRIAGVVPPVPPAPPAPPVAANDRPDSPSAAHAGVEGDKSGLEGMPRFVQHAIRAADEAMMDARWMPEEEEDRVRTGVCVGGGIGSISEVAAAGHLLFEQKPRRISPHFVPRILINMAAGHISIRHRLKGPNHASVTACASSAHAIADAFRLVRCGAADVIVAGGTEACVDALSLAGFSRWVAGAACTDALFLAGFSRWVMCLAGCMVGMGGTAADVIVAGGTEACIDALSLAGFSWVMCLAGCMVGMGGTAADVIVAGGTEACIDALSLAGFSRMAEGAGVLVLEDLDHAVQRGAKVYAEVRGAGSSADAFHITQPSPLATGAVLCMRAALKEAGLQPSDIGYLNAHATSTPLGDEIEALALKAVFDQHLLSGDLSFNPRDEIEALALKAVFDQHVLSGDLSFSSSKGAMGHLLGAAGAVEAAVAVMALHHVSGTVLEPSALAVEAAVAVMALHHVSGTVLEPFSSSVNFPRSPFFPTFPIPSLPSLSQPLQGVVPPNVNLIKPDPSISPFLPITLL